MLICVSRTLFSAYLDKNRSSCLPEKMQDLLFMRKMHFFS